MVAWIFILFFACLALAFPVAVSLGYATLLPGLLSASFSGNPAFVFRSVIAGINVTTILAIPLFMLSGAIMAEGGLSEKLFDVFAYFLGKRRGGMPNAVVVTCLFFGALSGSGAATCAAVGAMCIPFLTELGYEKKFSAALVATASGLGVIIPPSIPFIAYALVSDASVSSLFTAGILPGCLIAACIMLYVTYYCFKHGEDREKIDKKYLALRRKGLFRVLKEGFWALLAPLFILGGIYSGIVTPTEAACISVFYSIFICLFAYKTIELKDLLSFFRKAVASFAPLGLMMGLAMAFAKVLVLLNAPQQLAEVLANSFNNKYTFLIVLNLALILIGMVMDVAPAMMILTPMLLPFATSLGIDPVHLGVIMVCNLSIGFVTPPFGLNLFIISPMIREDVLEIGRKALPFILAFAAALIIITYVPAIALCLL